MGAFADLIVQPGAKIPDEKFEQYKNNLFVLAKGLGLGTVVQQSIGNTDFQLFKYGNVTTDNSGQKYLYFDTERSGLISYETAYLALENTGNYISSGKLAFFWGAIPGNVYCAAVMIMYCFVAASIENGYAIPCLNGTPYLLNIPLAQINTTLENVQIPYNCFDPFFCFADLTMRGLTVNTMEKTGDYYFMTPEDIAEIGRIFYAPSMVEIAAAKFGLQDLPEHTKGIFPGAWQDDKSRVTALVENFRAAVKEDNLSPDQIVDACLEGVREQKILYERSGQGLEIYEGKEPGMCMSNMPMLYLLVWCDMHKADFWNLVKQAADRYKPYMKLPTPEEMKQEKIGSYVTNLANCFNSMCRTEGIEFCSTAFSFSINDVGIDDRLEVLKNYILDVMELKKNGLYNLKPFQLPEDAALLKELSTMQIPLNWDVYTELLYHPQADSSLLIWALLKQYVEAVDEAASESKPETKTEAKTDASAEANENSENDKLTDALKKLMGFVYLLDNDLARTLMGLKSEEVKTADKDSESKGSSKYAA